MENLTYFTSANKPQFQADTHNIDESFKETKLNKYSSQVYIYNMRLLDNLINNKVNRSELTEKLINAIAKFDYA